MAIGLSCERISDDTAYKTPTAFLSEEFDILMHYSEKANGHI